MWFKNVRLKLLNVLSKIKNITFTNSFRKSHTVSKTPKSKAPQRKQSALSVGPEISDMIKKTSYKMFLASLWRYEKTLE